MWALSALCALGVQGQLLQVSHPYCESRPQLGARSRRKAGHFGVEGMSNFVAIAESAEQAGPFAGGEGRTWVVVGRGRETRVFGGGSVFDLCALWLTFEFCG